MDTDRTPILADDIPARELRVAIGAATIGLVSADPGFCAMVEHWCGVFRSEAEPHYWLEVILREGRSAPEIQCLIQGVRVRADDGGFVTEPPLWRAEYHPTEHRLRFETERDLFHPTIQPRFLNVLLSSLYNSYCEDLGTAARASYLVHGCGVAVDGHAFLFTGPSGAGKTTIAGLSRDYTVLNDEVVLLTVRGREVAMSGTPLLGGLNRRSRQTAPLKAVVLLRHGREPSLREVEAREAYPRFLAQIFELSPVLSSGTGRMRWLEHRMDLACAVLERLPCYELTFRQDDSFWPVLRALA